ncbi:MAG TPA: hypothetical protein VFQ41_10250 [Candidatus Angelobacter sp.]|nr:hypothetical protein [Candidatus Angelobacter sp.]
MAALGIFLIAATALCITWYSLSLRYKRKKAKEILRWIQSSLCGRGHVVGISWISPSRFRVPLRLTCGVFQRAWVLVELNAQQTPVQWLLSKIKAGREVVKFQADLDCPPGFSLQMQNFRWFVRSGHKSSIKRPGWQFERLQSVMISTKPELQREIASTMASLSKGDSGDFLEVSFQRRSPHFSATLPLESLAPGSPARSYVLEAMRELAGNASVF